MLTGDLGAGEFCCCADGSDQRVRDHAISGKERDAETGNDDFGARYYSNRYGRWLSADWSSVPAPVPYANLNNPQTLNLYAMVSDDPETFADLDGHFTLGTSAFSDAGWEAIRWSSTNDQGGCILSGTCVGFGGIYTTDQLIAGGLAQVNTQSAQQQTAQELASQIPPEVKAAIQASVDASNNPTTDDKKGGFHEESGIAGTDTSGHVVISPEKPGPYANPDKDSEAHTSAQPADPSKAGSIAQVTVNWHVHPSGKTETHKFVQPPSDADKRAAVPGAINVVVGAGNKTVYFYSNGGPPVHMRLDKFMGGP